MCGSGDVGVYFTLLAAPLLSTMASAIQPPALSTSIFVSYKKGQARKISRYQCDCLYDQERRPTSRRATRTFGSSLLICMRNSGDTILNSGTSSL